jgi:hypothetical protein
MRPRRGHAKLAVLLVACAVAIGAVVAAVLVTNDGHDGTASGPIAPTTGSWAPITIPAHKVPIIAGGIPVDIDPQINRTDFGTTLLHLGPHEYRMTIFNTSNLGTIHSFQWYPPTGVRVTKLIDSSAGQCTLTGLKGFGGNQFPGVVLYPNILCSDLDLKAPSCMCLGDGGDVEVTFATNRDLVVGEGDLRIRAATLAFDRVPLDDDPRPPQKVMRIVPGATGAASAGGLSASEREDAQRVLDTLQDSNISFQLVSITRWLQSVPTACRVRRVSEDPSTYAVYLFWTPWLAANPYVWLNMTVGDDPRKGTYELGAAQPVLPGGRLKPNGRSVNRRSVDTTLLSRYGPEQAKAGRKLLVAHGGDVFAGPGATCQVLTNGSLKLVPS